jgi:hypothetical protein
MDELKLSKYLMPRGLRISKADSSGVLQEMKCDLCENVARHACRWMDESGVKQSNVCTVCAGKLWAEQKSFQNGICFVPLVQTKKAGELSPTGSPTPLQITYADAQPGA